MPLATPYAFNGETLDSLLGSFDGQALYADGFNLYAYVGGNPVNGADPAGLFTFGDLLSGFGTGASWGFSAYNAYSLANQFAGDLAAGVGLRNAFMNLAIQAALDYAGGKAFDLALRGLNAVARGARLARLERSKAWREVYEEAGGAIPDRWVLHHLCPRQFETWFRTKVMPPINIDDPRWAMALDPGWHDWLHSSKGFDWNKKWQWFIDDHAHGATAEAVYGHLEKLKREAGEALKRHFGVE